MIKLIYSWESLNSDTTEDSVISLKKTFHIKVMGHSLLKHSSMILIISRPHSIMIYSI